MKSVIVKTKNLLCFFLFVRGAFVKTFSSAEADLSSSVLTIEEVFGNCSVNGVCCIKKNYG